MMLAVATLPNLRATIPVHSPELIKYMSYIFRLIDTVAEYARVHKVKTIGDAYLAIAGLSEMSITDSCCCMLDFASWCAQIFSNRFAHPSEGQILRIAQVCNARVSCGAAVCTHARPGGLGLA